MIKEFAQICTELTTINYDLSEQKARKILQLIFSAKRVFLSGEGRSGLMIRALANRLTQAGLQVHVVSEITCPAINAEDLLILNSASGTSSFLLGQAKSAKHVGATILTFTAKRTTPLSQTSDEVIVIEAQTKDTNQNSVQPMGSLYEQASLLLFDSLILKALHANLITTRQLRDTHSNLE
ncbi:6-phospho-3-hexuloisomerase [Lactobacillus sp.]|uniref:6-phospho-3-hexuloisomerase n=1 Tax=Lactobacillus sp. TaxID=1591 RepID=UPI0025F2D759|nr:6-phospho-3-hexuloisomerase [Lactobacillus sp.]MCO6532164.1 SIS domain-containing protein [Lactobacillus sp.]